MNIMIPWWKIAILLSKRLPKALNETAKARRPKSDSGKKITRDEWEEIVFEVLLGLGSEFTELIVEANDYA